MLVGSSVSAHGSHHYADVGAASCCNPPDSCGYLVSFSLGSRIPLQGGLRFQVPEQPIHRHVVPAVATSTHALGHAIAPQPLPKRHLERFHGQLCIRFIRHRPVHDIVGMVVEHSDGRLTLSWYRHGTPDWVAGYRAHARAHVRCQSVQVEAWGTLVGVRARFFALQPHFFIKLRILNRTPDPPAPPIIDIKVRLPA